MSVEMDLLIERIAVKNGLLAGGAIAAARGVQERLRAAGVARRLSDVLVEQGLLSDRQVKQVFRAARQTLERMGVSSPSPLPSGEGGAKRRVREPAPSARETRIMAADETPAPARTSRKSRKTAAAEPPASRETRTATAAPAGRAVVLARRGNEDTESFERRLEAEIASQAATEADLADLGPGSLFGSYEIVGSLGSGGMAHVFRAKEVAGEREVALKVMRREIAGDPAYIRRFCREAAHALRVDHPNVARVFEVGAVGGRHYYTMELVCGESLSDAVNRGLADDEALAILRQVADGLAALHKKGIAHRDLKPNNVVLTTMSTRYGFGIQGEPEVLPKIVDFGLARGFDEKSADDGNRLFGTAKYLAPELARNQPWDGRADVFALGVTAYQVLTGCSPFECERSVDYIACNMKRDAVPLRELRPDLPVAVSDLVARMMARDPERRYQASDVVRAIDAIQAGAKAPDLDADGSISVVLALGRHMGGLGANLRLVAAAAVVAVAVLIGLALAGRDARETVAADAPAHGAVACGLTSSAPAPDVGREVSGRLAARCQDETARGDALAASGNLDGALDAYAAARRLLPAGASTDEIDARIQGVRVARLLAEADGLVGRGLRARAIETLRPGAEDPRVHERLAALEAAATAEDLFAQAERLEASGDRAGARDLYRGALDAMRHSAGQAALSEEFVLARVESIDRAVAEGEGRQAVRSALEEAVVAVRLGDAARALTLARQAAAADPADPVAGRVVALLEARLTPPQGMAFVPGTPAGAPAFFVDRTPATNRAYERFLAATPGALPPAGWQGRRAPYGTEEQPVRGVRLADARAFAAWAGKVLPGTESAERASDILGGRADVDALLATDIETLLGRERLSVSPADLASDSRAADEVLATSFRLALPLE